MSSVVISGDTSGTITLSAPAVAGTNTLTLPAATGTVMVSGNMPAFSATINKSGSDQGITASTWTKAKFDTTTFDTNSNFSTANNRFTPTVAGYYQINVRVSISATVVNPNGVYASIYKNGSAFKSASMNTPGGGLITGSVQVNELIYFNGSTDYVEAYGYAGGGNGVYIYGNNSVYCSFSGLLVRAA